MSTAFMRKFGGSALPDSFMFALRDVDMKPCSATRGAVKSWTATGTGRSGQTIGKNRGPLEEIRPGDVVWFPPGEKHWHGATRTTTMTAVAIHLKNRSLFRLICQRRSAYAIDQGCS